MKNLNVLNLSIAIFISGLFLGSCTAKSNENTGKVESGASLSEQTNPIISAYLQLKDDLVETDSKKAQKSANKFITSIKDVEDDGIKTIRESAEKIAASADVSVQREHFETLSDDLYIYAQTHDMGIKLYRQYCPMAFQNKGAYWLSSEKVIMNPYFGDKMLHCGLVKEEL